MGQPDERARESSARLRWLIRAGRANPQRSTIVVAIFSTEFIILKKLIASTALTVEAISAVIARTTSLIGAIYLAGSIIAL